MNPDQDISLEQLRTLIDVSGKINSQLDLTLLLNEIMDLAVELLKAEKGLIFLLEDGSINWEARVARSVDKKTMHDVVAMSKSTIEKVVRSCEPVLLKGILGSDPGQATPSLFRHKLQSIFCVPLKATEQLMGVIYLDTTDKKHFFSEKDIPFMHAFANLAAVAIEKARSFNEVAHLNENLENLVQKRTEQLAAQHEELQKAHRELKEAQLSLIRSEKMASLGMLVAGIVHEVNTPLGSIHSNIDILKRSLAKLGRHLKGDEAKNVIQEDFSLLRKTLDVMYGLVEVNEKATVRIQKILERLRNFSRLDEGELKKVDIHEGIDSTLDLIRYQYEDRIEIVKEYGDLPAISCRAGQLNQVFMNLMINACQAIPQKGKIRIRSFLRDNDVVVAVEDDGIGIPPEDLEKLFDPGFTSKGVGVGTGLGLSIAYRIVSDHGGNIEVESKPGKGSTFSVILPLQ